MPLIEMASKAELEAYENRVLDVLAKYPHRFMIHPKFFNLDASQMASTNSVNYVDDLIAALEILGSGQRLPPNYKAKKLDSSKWFELHPSGPTKLVYYIDGGVVYLRLFGHSAVITTVMNSLSSAEDKQNQFRFSVEFDKPSAPSITVSRLDFNSSKQKLDGILSKLKRDLVYDAQGARDLAMITMADPRFDLKAISQFQTSVDILLKSV